jgi:hypothetical protein
MIDDYIKYITLKRKELGGHAICPFAKKFLDKTEIIESDDLERDALKCLEAEEQPMVWVIYGCPKKFNKDWLTSFCDKHKDLAKSKDLWLIWDHPDQVNKIGEVSTNNKEYGIVLIQPLKELNNYSDKLKNSNYYGYWSKEYYNDIVKSREDV